MPTAMIRPPSARAWLTRRAVVAGTSKRSGYGRSCASGDATPVCRSDRRELHPGADQPGHQPVGERTARAGHLRAARLRSRRPSGSHRSASRAARSRTGSAARAGPGSAGTSAGSTCGHPQPSGAVRLGKSSPPHPRPAGTVSPATASEYGLVALPVSRRSSTIHRPSGQLGGEVQRQRPSSTGTAAGIVADVLTTSTSPGASSRGSSVNRWWLIRVARADQQPDPVPGRRRRGRLQGGRQHEVDCRHRSLQTDAMAAGGPVTIARAGSGPTRAAP